MSAEDKTKLDNADNTYALKSKYGDSTINIGRKAETDVGEYSTAEGQTTTASGNYSHAEGYNTIASGIGSHAEGSNYFLSGVPSSRKVTISNGEESTIYTIGGSYAYGINSHAEGTRSFAYGSSSHAEGCDTTASGAYSHAEGRDTTASGTYSHAEGDFITASGAFSHAEGNNTTASGNCSHAEGCYTTAGGRYSHAGGYYTKALKVAEFAHGQYNQSNNNTLFSIGDGTADDARHNAFEITTNGGKLHDKDIATTDLIPSTLPASGGNADTVGGIGIADLRQITQTVINTLPAVPNGEGDFLVNCDMSDTSFPYWYGHLSIRYGSYTGEYVAIFRTTGNDNKVYYNTYLTNHWSGWQEISATPIKSTTFSGTTDANSNISFWPKSENKIPILFECENKNASIFYGKSGYFYAYVTDHLHQNVNNTAVSGTVYYIKKNTINVEV